MDIKKKINLVKKNFYLAIFVVVLLFVVAFVIAQYDTTKASHETLYTNRIEPKTGSDVNVAGNLLVGGQPFGLWAVSGINLYYNLGNVGIGTTSPDNKLHIFAGDANQIADSNAHLVVENSGHAGINILAGSNYTAQIIFGDSGGPNMGGIRYFHGDDSLRLGTNQRDSDLILDNMGNVGIGTTSPGAELEVVGDVKITGVLAASPRIYLVEKNTQETLSATSWTNYMTQTITVDKNNSNVLFIFSFSQPYEAGAPNTVWRVGLGSAYSNAKYIKHAAENNWNVLPSGLSFLMTGVNAGTYTAELQYKFYNGQWQMSNAYQSEAYNSLIIIVL